MSSWSLAPPSLAEQRLLFRGRSRRGRRDTTRSKRSPLPRDRWATRLARPMMRPRGRLQGQAILPGPTTRKARHSRCRRRRFCTGSECSLGQTQPLRLARTRSNLGIPRLPYGVTHSSRKSSHITRPLDRSANTAAARSRSTATARARCCPDGRKRLGLAGAATAGATCSARAGLALPKQAKTAP